MTCTNHEQYLTGLGLRGCRSLGTEAGASGMGALALKPSGSCFASSWAILCVVVVVVSSLSRYQQRSMNLYATCPDSAQHHNYPESQHFPWPLIRLAIRHASCPPCLPFANLSHQKKYDKHSEEVNMHRHRHRHHHVPNKTLLETRQWTVGILIFHLSIFLLRLREQYV